jgi:hypothetical protein
MLPLNAQRSRDFGRRGSMAITASTSAPKPCAAAGSPLAASSISAREPDRSPPFDDCNHVDSGYANGIEFQPVAVAVYRIFRTCDRGLKLSICPRPMLFALCRVAIAHHERGGNQNRMIKIRRGFAAGINLPRPDNTAGDQARRGFSGFPKAVATSLRRLVPAIWAAARACIGAR